MALYQTVVFASAVAGPLLGGWLADTFGFQVIFGASGAGRLLGIVLFIWLAVWPILGASPGARHRPEPCRRRAMLLSNGRIYTLDPGDRVVDTLVVRAGRVVFAGRRRDVNVPAGEAEIDLGGRAVLPGLVDAHGHLMYLARLRLTLDVAGLASEAACAGHVAAACRVRPPRASGSRAAGGIRIAGRAPASRPGRHSTARRPSIP